MILKLTNDDIKIDDSSVTSSIVAGLEIQKQQWYFASKNTRLQQAEWELAYYGISHQSLEKRFKVFFKGKDGKLLDKKEYDKLKRKKEEANLRKYGQSYDETLKVKEECDLVTREMLDGTPVTNMILNDIASEFIDTLCNKNRVHDLDYGINRQAEYAIQKFMTTYGQSATANLQIQQVVKDYTIKGQGLMRACLDKEKTNNIDGLDIDHVILPANHTSTEYISGYYIVHSLSRDETRNRFPKIFDYFNEKSKKDKTNDYSHNSFVSLYPSSNQNFDVKIAGYIKNTKIEDNKSNKNGRPPYEVMAEKYLSKIQNRGELASCGGVWKIGTALKKMYDEYDNNKFTDTLCSMEASKYNTDFISLQETGRNDLLKNFHSNLGILPSWTNGIFYNDKNFIDIIEWVDLENNTRCYYCNNIMITKLEDISKIKSGLLLTEIRWNSTTASNLRTAPLTSLVGDLYRDFKELIFVSEIVRKIEGYAGAAKVLIDGTKLDASAIDQLQGENPIVLMRPSVDISSAYDAMEVGLSGSPLVTPLNLTPPNAEYWFQKPQFMEQKIKNRIDKITQINYQITKEQAAKETNSRSIALNLYIDNFFNELASSFPYTAIRYMLTHWDNTLFIPNLETKKEEVRGSNIKVDTKKVPYLNNKEVSFLSSTQNVDMSIYYNSIGLIISEDRFEQEKTRLAIMSSKQEMINTLVAKISDEIKKSPEFKQQVILEVSKMKQEKTTAMLEGTGLKVKQPDPNTVRPPREKIERFGMDMTEEDLEFEAIEGEEIKPPTKKDIAPDLAFQIQDKIFQTMLQGELEKQNIQAPKDFNIYLTRAEIELSIINGIFSIKPPKSTDEILRDYQELATIATNFGAQIDGVMVAKDVATLKGYSEDIVMSSQRQKEYKVGTSVSLSLAATPSQTNAIVPQLMGIEMPKEAPPELMGMEMPKEAPPQ